MITLRDNGTRYIVTNVDKATALYDEAISLARDAKGDGKLSLIC
jgi:hypothetical protein